MHNPPPQVLNGDSLNHKLPGNVHFDPHRLASYTTQNGLQHKSVNIHKLETSLRFSKTGQTIRPSIEQKPGQ